MSSATPAPDPPAAAVLHRGRAALGTFLAAALVLAGCASTPAVLDYGGVAAQAPVWPSPPEPPRYRFIGQLTGEGNFHSDRATQGVGRRVLGWLVGLMAGRHTPVVLQRPQDGFVDAQGRIYVTDVSRAAVYVFDEAAGRLRVWEMADRRTRFETPLGIAPGADGEILVADADLHRVVRLDRNGEPRGSIGAGVLQRPVGLARDVRRGRLFVADAQGHDIKIFSDAGRLIGTIGRRGEGKGEFNAPTYLAYAHDRLYVTDTLNARIQVFDADGRFLHMFGRRGLYIGDLPRPKGVAVDKDGNIYVVESYYDHLLVFNGEGELLLPIGGTGSGIGEFYLPAGVWTDHRERVFVADAFNGRVMIFQYLGGA